ncbi:MAG: hypothetical protein DRP65_02375 [Planctomycetota bacterium]|nr:MAG: hypothetical protein DRP65_02375 [Planctomycetota bacterium]
MSEIAINIVYEDALSEAVLRKLLEIAEQDYIVGISYPGGGFGRIRSKIVGFNNAAKGMPYLVLTDIDRTECAPVLIKEWLQVSRHPNLLLRVAVRQVEAWILANRTPFSEFIGINKSLIPPSVDNILDTKKFLVNLARKSRRRKIRDDIVPRQGSTARVGPDYNGRLISFVENLWEPNEARQISPSLDRTMRVLDRFQPILGIEA